MVIIMTTAATALSATEHDTTTLLWIILMLAIMCWYNKQHDVSYPRRRSRSKSKTKTTTDVVLAKIIKALRSKDKNKASKAALKIANLLESGGGVSPITPGLAENIQHDEDALEIMTEVLSHQQRDNTLKQYGPAWRRWVEFAIDHEYDIYPQADTNERQKFDADFGHFAVTEYKRCRDKIYTTGVNKGKKHPNTPSTYAQVFQGINHIITHIFGLASITTPLVQTLKVAYKAQYSRPVVKARPMLGRHLVKLVKLADRLNQDWLTLTADIAVMAWMSAGRWDCIYNIDVQKSIGNCCPIMGPGLTDEYWLLYMKQRKNRKHETLTECLRIDDKRLDPRSRFISVVTKYGREKSERWAPRCKKVPGKNLWTVDSNPSNYLVYDTFLQMFRHAMKLANIQNEFDCEQGRKWSCHAFRQGFVTNIRHNGKETPIRVETIARHGTWNEDSVPVILGYSNASASEHVAALRPAVLAALYKV